MQVQAEVVGQLAAVEHVVQQPAVARPQHHRVVRHVGVLALGAEVPDEQAHRVAAAVDAAIGPVAAVLGRHQLLVGPGGVGVAHHDVGRDALAAGQCDAGGAAVVDLDALDLGAQAQRAAQVGQHADQALDQRADAAHRPMHAEAAFQRVDQAVHAGHGKGVAADQQRLQAERHTQFRVLHVAGHHRVQAAPAAHAHQQRCRLEQVADVVEGLGAQPMEAELVAQLGFDHETLEAGGIRRADAAHLGAHAVGVAAVVEVVAIVETDAVEGLQCAQRHLLGPVAAGQRPQFVEQVRHRHDGRPGVEDVAVAVVHVGAAAGGVQLFQHGHAPALGRHPHRRGQAAESAADHHGMRLVRSHQHGANLADRKESVNVD